MHGQPHVPIILVGQINSASRAHPEQSKRLTSAIAKPSHSSPGSSLPSQNDAWTQNDPCHPAHTWGGTDDTHARRVGRQIVILWLYHMYHVLQKSPTLTLDVTAIPEFSRCLILGRWKALLSIPPLLGESSKVSYPSTLLVVYPHWRSLTSLLPLLCSLGIPSSLLSPSSATFSATLVALATAS